jgi:hypothetical protein
MPQSKTITWLAAAVLPLLASTALAQDAGKSVRDAGSREAAAAAASASGSVARAPEAESEGDDALPAGHPQVADANPHAHAAGGTTGGLPGTFEPPPDLEEADPTLPPGTIVVDLRDADEKPVAREEVTLGMIINSVAKGDSRKHLQATTDERGRVAFHGLELASNIAYRVSVGYPHRGRGHRGV